MGEVALCLIGHTARVERRSVCRVYPDRLAEIRDHAVALAIDVPGVRAGVIGGGVIWIAPDRLGEVGNCAVKIALLDPAARDRVLLITHHPAQVIRAGLA